MSARFDIVGSGAGAVKAIQDLNAALDKTEKHADLSAAATKRLEQSAQRIKEAVNPQEKYNRQMKELAEHVAAGRIKIDEAELATSRYAKSLERASASGDRAFGDKFISNIAGAAAGMVSLGSVVAMAQKGFAELETRAQGAADRIFNAIGAYGELQQFDTAEGKQALGAARRLVRVGAVKPENQAQAIGIGSNLVNAGLSDAEMNFLIDDVAGSKLVAAENLDRIGGNLAKIKRVFNEEDLRGVTGRVLKAAGATQADLGATSREMLKYAPLAAATGSSLDEAAAAFVVAEEGSASPEAAAEYLKSFYSQVYRRGLASGDLQGTVANIEKKIGKGTPFSALGDANAVIGYELLSKNMTRVTELEESIGQAQFRPGGVVRADPVLQAATLRSRAEGRLASTEESLTTERENLFDALAAERRERRMRSPAFGPIGAMVGSWVEAIDDSLGREDVAFRRALSHEQAVPGSLSPDLKSGLEDYMRRTAEGVEALRGRVATRPE